MPPSLGAPNYMAPELCQGKEAGPGADVYALGVLLYEAIRARAPFAPRTSRANPATTMKRHIFEKPLALSMRYGALEHIKAYEGLTMTALAKKADKRQSDAGALYAEARRAALRGDERGGRERSCRPAT